MKKSQLFLCVCVGGILLAGCSNKPGVSDVKEVIKQGWEKCELMKPTNFQKINGIDQGSSYQMAISYEFEVFKDIAVDDYNPDRYVDEQNTAAPVPANDPNHMQLQAEQNQRNNAIRDAAQQRFDKYWNNCPTGGDLTAHMDRSDILIQLRGRTTPLAKGEKIKFTKEYTMVKSEKGWIVQ